MEAAFDSEITLTGPFRSPAQMLASQLIRGRASLHDESVANTLGIQGAPIEGTTHFSQFEPLGALIWRDAWFERGCLSCHFRTMVAEGELVQASLTTRGPERAEIHAMKSDGTPVLSGTASIGPTHPPTALDLRRESIEVPDDFTILDQLDVGMKAEFSTNVSITFDDDNGLLYPFSLNEKLKKITEPHKWYTREGGSSSPWGRAILPMEMISVLAHKLDPRWPIRSPSVGLFLDLEVRLISGPLFVEQEYSARSEIVGLSSGRRTESYWSLTTLSDIKLSETMATVLLHAGVFKDSYHAAD
jgi:hypothetical protein